MLIDVRYQHTKPRGDLAEYIEKEMQKLGKLSKNIAYIEIDVVKNTHHRKGAIFSVRASVHIVDRRAPLFHAESSREGEHEAVDELIDELWKQMSSYKEKRKAFDRTAIRKAKGKE
ncbi:MAG: HPF/RaiA family ribosome-associated protein [bacterium]|nr:HPF/RaiA family ribosome-associated protein [bacterium]